MDAANTPADLEDGIYFQLPETEYHALPRLSASGCNNLLTSPATFWADSWLNPEKVKEDEATEDEKTAAQIVGSAYHTARLEPHRFDDLYVCEPDPDDYPKALMNGTQIGEALAELGQAKKRAGETVVEQAARLYAAGYKGHIWPLIKDDWEEQRGERFGLKPKVYREIKRDMERLHSNTDISPFLTGGQAEVSILWTDKNGTRWKCRIDYLKPRHIVDLKTFENSFRKNLEQCVIDAVRFNRYYVPAYVYWCAAEEVRAGKLPIRKVQNAAQKDLIEQIRESQDPFEFWWIFQEKGGVPNVLARQLQMTAATHPHYLFQAPDEAGRELLKELMKSPSRIWDKAKIEVEHAEKLFRQCLDIWGAEPWGAMNPVSRIDDESFSSFFLES